MSVAYEVSVSIPTMKGQDPFAAMDRLIGEVMVSADYGYDMMTGEREAFISTGSRAEAEGLEGRIVGVLAEHQVSGALVKVWEHPRD